MSRTFQDDDLLLWEVYTASPRSGMGHGARIMFHCLTAPERRARVLEQDSDEAGIETRIAEADTAELMAMLEESEPLE